MSSNCCGGSSAGRCRAETNFAAAARRSISLSIQVKVAKGQATVEEVTLRSAGVQLEIAGAASIPGRELDLKGVATLIATSSSDRKSFELPFVVQGPWDDPLMLPDAQILIQRSGAAAPLLDALRGRNEREAARPGAGPPRPQRRPPRPRDRSRRALQQRRKKAKPRQSARRAPARRKQPRRHRRAVPAPVSDMPPSGAVTTRPHRNRQSARRPPSRMPE